MDQDENQKSDNKRRQSLSIDKAAFLLLRIKRVFKKRSQSHHIEKRYFKTVYDNTYFLIFNIYFLFKLLIGRIMTT